MTDKNTHTHKFEIKIEKLYQFVKIIDLEKKTYCSPNGTLTSPQVIKVLFQLYFFQPNEVGIKQINFLITQILVDKITLYMNAKSMVLNTQIFLIILLDGLFFFFFNEKNKN